MSRPTVNLPELGVALLAAQIERDAHQLTSMIEQAQRLRPDCPFGSDLARRAEKTVMAAMAVNRGIERDIGQQAVSL